MTTGLSQQQTLAPKVERLVERAITFAVDEHDDGLAVARLAWLAQDDHAALEEAGGRRALPMDSGRSAATSRPHRWPSLPDPLAIRTADRAGGGVRP
jgi:hypothetical protein